MGSEVDINICPDANTYGKEGVGLEVGWLEQTYSATQWCPCLHVTIPRGRADMESQVDMYTWSDACTHFNQGVGPKTGEWNTVTVTHMSTQEVSMKLSIGGWANMGSWVDISTCTDAYTHSKEGVGPEVDWLEHTHCATHGNHVSM